MKSFQANAELLRVTAYFVEGRDVGDTKVLAEIAKQAGLSDTVVAAFLDGTAGTEEVRLDAETAKVQNELWAAVSRPAMAQPTPVIALAVGGMNDVLNSQGYTQAAWWNRIPGAAWMLMFAIAIFCNGLLGYGSRRLQMKLLVILPLVVAVSFFLIADIDSPRRGIIRVRPQNLESVQQSLK